jgi:hypothetical protein
MPSGAWERIERLVSRSSALTLPRAYGEVIEQLLANLHSTTRGNVHPSLHTLGQSVGQPIEGTREDWQAWQMQKELALLAASARERWQRDVAYGLQ